jgi:DNA-binding CsgD family transcriptional regulator
LVLRGEPGIGKTALLDYLSTSASGCRINRAGGVDSEMELAFAGLHQICAPFLDRLARLPGPQREALGTAFGLRAGPIPDPFLVGLAVLSLLSEAAEHQPLVCILDDAQWLDQASSQAFAFVARRLAAESIGLVFAVREPHPHLTGLPELVVQGLLPADARELLRSVVPGPMDDRIRDRIVAETQGNPLALLELPHSQSVQELTTGLGAPDALPLASRIEEAFSRRLEPLPPTTRLLLVVAAAEPVGDAVLIRRAADLLDVPPDAVAPATAAGLIDFTAELRFRHPLVRSAVYRAAPPEERRAVHRALAEATDPDIDPDRRAWHRAKAATGPDESVAGELERSAERAQTRGGLAATAAFLERAALLSPDPGQRGRRALAAGQAKLISGAPDAALTLLAVAQAGPLDELEHARADLLRAQIAFGSSHGRDAPPLLLAAAKRLEPLDAPLARDTYRDALAAALLVGRLGGEVGALQVAQAVGASKASPTRVTDLILEGLARLITDGYAGGAPLLQQAVAAFRDADLPVGEALRWLWFATHSAHDLWDDENWEVLCTRHVRLVREAGALTMVPFAVNARMGLHLYAGELDVVTSLVEEVATVAEVTGIHLPSYGAVALAAWRGREAEATPLIEATADIAISRGEGMGLTIVYYSSAVLFNSLGRYEEACAVATLGAEYPSELAFATWSLIELVEAAVRSGRLAQAADAQRRLALTTGPSDTDWALGIEARSRALLSEDETAETLYREAIDRLSRTRIRVELARAHLLYGEWLRRDGRRVNAREQLRTAHGMFTAMGTEAFAERARRELLATGETVRGRTPDTRAVLTAQEAQIAGLAGDGLTNREIAAQLFISSHTVEWHLRKVFAKLDISSRRQLRAYKQKPGSVASG